MCWTDMYKSDTRGCEVSLFEAECKALCMFMDVEIGEGSAEIHSVWICHKCKKTLLDFELHKIRKKKVRNPLNGCHL